MISDFHINNHKKRLVDLTVDVVIFMIWRS